MMGITNKQILAILVAVLSTISVATTQMVDIFGPALAKTIMSAAGLLNMILGGALAVITSQGSIVRDVQAMPGIEKITTNEQSNKVLADLTMDRANPKIEAAPGSENAVAKIAME